MNTMQSYSGEHHPPAPELDIYLPVPDTFNWLGPLGRNVLNRLDLRLEGPKLRTHILGG